MKIKQRYCLPYALPALIVFLSLALSYSFQVMANPDNSINLGVMDSSYQAGPMPVDENTHLSLQDVLQLMLQHNPELASFSRKYLLLKAQSFRQAGLGIQNLLSKPRMSILLIQQYNDSRLFVSVSSLS